jgi:nucleotide-binding universal stress UspA family protein
MTDMEISHHLRSNLIMKVVLIPVSDRPECALALKQGFALAKKVGANIIGYHMRPHSYSAVKLPTSLVAIDDELSWEQALSAKSNKNSHIDARVLFEKIANQFDYDMVKKPNGAPAAMWIEKVGSPKYLFSITGPVSDLIIVSRPASNNAAIAKSIMLNAVMHSSTPVLVLPQTAESSIGKRICIAWNQSTEAALAVKSTMPLLQQAEQVSIVTCGAENLLGPKSRHLIKYLASSNIKAEHIAMQETDATTAILAGYQQTDSDLLLMGGYSRSRMRQIIFGGVSEYMLNEANIPVMILHT